MRRSFWLLAILTVFALSALPAAAANKTVKSKPAHKIIKMREIGLVHEQKYAIGFQSTWPAWGLSGQMDISDKITGQAVFGFAGDVNVYAARGLYTFQKSSTPFQHNFYGFAAVGDFTSPAYDINGRSTRESVIGFGAGVGVEAAPFEELPIWLNLEVGASFVNFENYSGFNMIGFGIGAHYRF